MSEWYSLEEIRDAAYETLAQVKESEYEYAESLLWAFKRRLTGEGEAGNE